MQLTLKISTVKPLTLLDRYCKAMSLNLIKEQVLENNKSDTLD